MTQPMFEPATFLAVRRMCYSLRHRAAPFMSDGMLFLFVCDYIFSNDYVYYWPFLRYVSDPLDFVLMFLYCQFKQ